jgi:hypothetical protein
MRRRPTTIERNGRKWKVWVIDETDVTVTVGVRPLRVLKPTQFTFPYRGEFNSFGHLAAEAIDRYVEAQTGSCHR